MRWRIAVLEACWGLGLLGCLPDDLPDQDRTSPRVASVSPSGRAVRVNESIVVEFTEPLIKATLNTDAIVVAMTSEVTDAFISDFNNPPLSDSRLDDIVPLTLAIADDARCVTLTAAGGFPPAAELTLLVSREVTDPSYNPLAGADGLKSHFRYDFVTDDGPPTVALTDLPASNLVPPNQRAIAVVFDQPVYNVTTATLTLRATEGADPIVFSIELDATRQRATLRLDDSGTGGCYTLCPLTTYTLAASSQIVDIDGTALVPFQQQVQTTASPDLASPVLTVQPLAIAGEDHAQIQWATDEPSSSAVRLGDAPDALTRRVLGEPAVACSGGNCTHVVDVDGLDLGAGSGRTYFYAIESLDAFNNPPLLRGPFSFSTQVLPKLAINEVYANPPPGPNSEDESYYEFVEIYNYSDADSYDLGSISLRVIGATQTTDLVPLQAGGPTQLAAGGYAVVGGQHFDPSAFALPGETLVLTDASSTRLLSYGIKNTGGQRLGLFLGLEDIAQAPLISSYCAPAALYRGSTGMLEGISAERLLPTAPDVDGSWCCSLSAPTPGVQNSVYGLSTCP
ncbi:MAG: Ig-like domain-containing protein [Deltaproteobacteria bacterium]|nr:Ig-like domain-containing protein [Deltaproteobacteria bacterium]